MPLDYASIINAGQSLVPDFAQQTLQRQQMQFQQQALKEQIAQRQIATQQAQQKQQRQVEFQTAVNDAIAKNDFHSIPRLMLQFPEFADQIKPGYDAMSKDGRAQNLSQLGTVIARATGGDHEGAAKLLEQRIAADKAAGQDTSEEEQALAMLRAPDQSSKNGALFGLRSIAYAADPEGYDKMAEALGFKVSVPTELQKNYDWLLANKGKAEADRYLAVQSDKFVPVDGKGVYRASDLIPATPGVKSGYGGGTFNSDGTQATSAQPSDTEGGDQSTGMGGVPAPALGANGLPDALTPEQYRVTVQSLGKEKTDEWMRRNSIPIRGGQSGPVRVRSIQQAMKLKPGTQYTTPDGRTFIR